MRIASATSTFVAQGRLLSDPCSARLSHLVARANLNIGVAPDCLRPPRLVCFRRRPIVRGQTPHQSLPMSPMCCCSRVAPCRCLSCCHGYGCCCSAAVAVAAAAAAAAAATAAAAAQEGVLVEASELQHAQDGWSPGRAAPDSWASDQAGNPPREPNRACGRGRELCRPCLRPSCVHREPRRAVAQVRDASEANGLPHPRRARERNGGTARRSRQRRMDSRRVGCRRRFHPRRARDRGACTSSGSWLSRHEPRRR